MTNVEIKMLQIKSAIVVSQKAIREVRPFLVIDSNLQGEAARLQEADDCLTVAVAFLDETTAAITKVLSDIETLFALDPEYVPAMVNAIRGVQGKEVI